LPISLSFPSPLFRSYLLPGSVLFADERHRYDPAPLLLQSLYLISLSAIPLFYPLRLYQHLDHVSLPPGFSFRISCPSLAIHPCIDASRINFSTVYHLHFLKLHISSGQTSTNRFFDRLNLLSVFLSSYNISMRHLINELKAPYLLTLHHDHSHVLLTPLKAPIFRHHRRQTHIYNSSNLIRNVILLYMNISVVLTP